jgi:monoamine oxidase
MSPARTTSSASGPPTVRSVIASQPGANPVGSAGTIGEGDAEPSPGDADASATIDALSVGLGSADEDTLGDAPVSADCCCAVDDCREHAAVEAARAKTIRATVQRVLIAEVLHRLRTLSLRWRREVLPHGVGNRSDGMADLNADAIVIGAGAAGLAAARSLAGRSLRVVLLEARSRVGGRVLSHTLAQSGRSAELGAEFIHGSAPETRALLREAGIASVDTGGESWTYDEGGDLQRDERDFAMAARIFDEARKLRVDETVDLFLQRYDQDDSMRGAAEMARVFVEGFDAADPAIASMRSIADEVYSGVDFASARPLGGYGPMFDRLRNDCVAAGVRMSFSTVVRRISWRRGSVRVEAQQGMGESHAVRARAAIVTLPVGVLRHTGDDEAVVFDPDLPSRKLEALQHIEMGHVVKVALWFRTAFWERIHGGRYRDASFFRSMGQPFPTYWTQFPVRNGLVVAWVGGPKAFALRETPRADLIDRALDGFGSLFGERELARRELEAGFMHDWGRDPFARGAYSYVAIGGDGARAALAAPVDGTLFFAGEATSNDGQGGTVNGALATGERAAREAAMSLGVLRE